MQAPRVVLATVALLAAAAGCGGTLCVALSGAALAIDQPGQRLTAIEYAGDVDPAAFVLPAPVSTTTAAPPTSR